MKRLLVLFLALMLLTSCALADLPEYINTESDMPIIKEGYDVTLKIVAKQNAGWGNAEDIWFWKYVEDQMNINVDVIQTQDAETYKSLAFASNELPDIFVGCGFGTSELVKYGELEGQLVDLAPYITEEYMPNLYAMSEKMPDLLSRISTAEGKIFSLPFVENGDLRSIACHTAGARFFINTKRLEAIGREQPETLEEMIDTLYALKEEDENVIPLGGSAVAYNPGSMILISMGYLTTDSWGLTPCLRNGEVVIPAGDREVFGEYLKIMNQLHKDGIIESDFFTMDRNAVDARMAENQYGLLGNVAYTTLPDTFADWWHINPLTSEWNDTKMWPTTCINLDSTALSYTVGGFVVTSACKDIATALRFADWFYDANSEHFGLSWWGPTAQMVEEQDIGYGITKGWVMNENLQDYYLDTNDPTQDYQFRYEHIFAIHSGSGLGNGMYSAPVKQLMAGLIDDIDKATIAQLNPDNGDDHYRISEAAQVRKYLVTMYPHIVFFSAEDNITISDYKVLINDYVKEETAKFVTGLRPVTDAELDSYFNALEGLGIQELLAFYADYYEALYK